MSPCGQDLEAHGYTAEHFEEESVDDDGLNKQQNLDIPVFNVYNLHMDSREIIRDLEREGWYRRNTKGSHHHYVHPEKPGVVTVQHPRKEIPISTLRSIFRQAGWDWRNRRK